jgi:hypothetical protein
MTDDRLNRDRQPPTVSTNQLRTINISLRFMNVHGNRSFRLAFSNPVLTAPGPRPAACPRRSSCPGSGLLGCTAGGKGANGRLGGLGHAVDGWSGRHVERASHSFTNVGAGARAGRKNRGGDPVGKLAGGGAGWRTPRIGNNGWVKVTGVSTYLQNYEPTLKPIRTGDEVAVAHGVRVPRRVRLLVHAPQRLRVRVRGGAMLVCARMRPASR